MKSFIPLPKPKGTLTGVYLWRRLEQKMSFPMSLKSTSSRYSLAACYFTDRRGRSFVWGSRSQSTLQVATKSKYSQIQTSPMNERAAGTQHQSPLIGRIWPWKNLFYVYVCRCVSVQIQKLTACLLWQTEVQQWKRGYWNQPALQSLWFFCRFMWLFYFLFLFYISKISQVQQARNHPKQYSQPSTNL